MARSALRRPFRWLYRVEVQGLDNLPGDGPVILAANHRSFMDSLFLAFITPRPIAFVAKAEYFDRRATRWIFRATGQIPLRRGSPAGARQAMTAASQVLDSGGIIGIYPEGTRSRDGELHRGNPGPARLAAATGAPIVPVGLIGTASVQGPGERLPRPFRRVIVRFGPPRAPTDGGSRRLREATDSLMQDIAALCGQRYVDRYSPLPGPTAG
ncbi:MAG TPA: lysophospholipid acyltransferase family protein [Acidimicrobiales bacterium]